MGNFILVNEVQYANARLFIVVKFDPVAKVIVVILLKSLNVSTSIVTTFVGNSTDLTFSFVILLLVKNAAVIVPPVNV